MTRFTEFLDPTHLQPWHFYWTSLWARLHDAHITWLAVAGVVTLAVQTVLRRSVDGAIVLLWLFLPLGLISLGTSKLYHYAYPFLPPVGLAIGYLCGLLLALGPVVFGRFVRKLERVGPFQQSIDENWTVADRASAGGGGLRRDCRLQPGVRAVADLDRRPGSVQELGRVPSAGPGRRRQPAHGRRARGRACGRLGSGREPPAAADLSAGSRRPGLREVSHSRGAGTASSACRPPRPAPGSMWPQAGGSCRTLFTTRFVTYGRWCSPSRRAPSLWPSP